MAVRKERLGILVGGGPSPGINSAISAVVIEAINSGLEVVGLRDGFQHLMDGPPRVEPLTIADVSRVHTTGGSILGTSRANPARDPAIRSRTAEAIKNLAIDHLRRRRPTMSTGAVDEEEADRELVQRDFSEIVKLKSCTDTN